MNRCPKSRILCLLLAVVMTAALILGLIWGIRNIDKLHLEKVPFLRPWLLQLDKQMWVRADLCPITPITWDMLDEEPEGYPDGYAWFDYLNSYTRLQLKRYMRESNLYILPREYVLMQNYDFERIMQNLEFGELSSPEER